MGISIAKSARAPTATARARERERERDPTHAPLRFVRSFRFPMWSRVIPMRAAAKSFAGQFRLGNSKSALGQRNFKRMWFGLAAYTAALTFSSTTRVACAGHDYSQVFDKGRDVGIKFADLPGFTRSAFERD